MPNTLTGTEAAAAIYAQVRARAARLTEPPCLAAVSVGAQPDDRAYLRSIALPDGTLRGDVTPAAAAIAACTPVPGGIGSVTTALLLRHTVQAAEKSHHF